MSRRRNTRAAWTFAAAGWLAYLLLANRLAISALRDEGDVAPERGRAVSVQLPQIETVVETLEVFGKSLLDKTELKGRIRWASAPIALADTVGAWRVEWVFASDGATYRAPAHIRVRDEPGFVADVRAMVIPLPIAPGTYQLGLCVTDGDNDLAFGWTDRRFVSDRRGWKALPAQP